MTDTDGATEGRTEEIRETVVAAALPHVPFDGWSDKTLAYAVEDAGVDRDRARLAFPRGGVDLALAFHDQRDAELARALAGEELHGMRFRDRVAHAVIKRLELIESDREAVRRAATLFALPNHAADGARVIWRTADTIWSALGDTSRDYNWYTKRATLAAVYSSSLLYWLGDETPHFSATRDFVQRRIDDVMQFEEVKARIAKNPIARMVTSVPRLFLDQVRAPGDAAADLPGRWPRRP
jgi:ubiquinone biosynthesis protein COQ9